MLCSIGDLKNKQLVNTDNGSVIGYVGDIEIDTENGTVSGLIVYGRSRLLGLMGREDDLQIPWGNIEVIGDETILVSGTFSCKKIKHKIL